MYILVCKLSLSSSDFLLYSLLIFSIVQYVPQGAFVGGRIQWVFPVYSSGDSALLRGLSQPVEHIADSVHNANLYTTPLPHMGLYAASRASLHKTHRGSALRQKSIPLMEAVLLCPSHK